MNDFIKIPTKIILDKCCLNRYNKKLPYIITELYLAEDRRSKVKITIKELILTLGQKPSRTKGRNIDQFKHLVSLLFEDDIISRDDNGIISVDSLIKGKLNIPYDYNENNETIRWFKVKINDYFKVIESKNKLNKITLLNIYYYILSRIIRRNNKIENINITGGMAEAFFDTYDSISKHLGVSKNSLKTYTDELRNLKLVYCGNIGKITNGEVIREANMVYATNEDELKEGLKQSKYYWESQGWKLIK